MRSIWRSIQFLPEYRWRILSVIFVGTVLGAIGTGTPYLYKRIVDVISGLLAGRIAQAYAVRSAAILLSVFFMLRLGIVVFGAWQGKQADQVFLDTMNTFRKRVFDNMTRMSIDYFEKTRAGEIMDRFGAIHTVTQWLFSLTEGTLANTLQMLFIIAALLYRSPVIGLVMSGVVAFNLTLSYRTVRRSKPYRRGWQALVGRMTGLLGEMIGNIATVRSFGGELAVKQRYDHTQAEWKVTRQKLLQIEWRSTLVINVANAAGIFAGVAVTTYGALHGRFTPGDILFILTLSQNLINSLNPIARQINQMSDIDSIAERLVELLEVDTEVADHANAVELDRLESVEFDHVAFAYPGRDAATLQDISFKMDGGETIALVGPSGSGKTTIVKLLMRFYDPTAGRILVNGRDLREFKQRSVRAKMGVVLQDVALFNDSIGENIAFAKAGASVDDVRAAALAAHADEFIRRMPDQYDTLVGERGIKLSGGEKQRVAIARAILKDPQLIILDEATSALDSESEHAVQKGLERLTSGRCSVVIAHRLSTVMSADQILVFKGGRIVERGRHSALASQTGGLYARLLALQIRAEHGASTR